LHEAAVTTTKTLTALLRWQAGEPGREPCVLDILVAPLHQPVGLIFMLAPVKFLYAKSSSLSCHKTGNPDPWSSVVL
jgi:hypothetical protein